VTCAQEVIGNTKILARVETDPKNIKNIKMCFSVVFTVTLPNTLNNCPLRDYDNKKHNINHMITNTKCYDFIRVKYKIIYTLNISND